jgi:hypothetical protein
MVIRSRRVSFSHNHRTIAGARLPLAFVSHRVLAHALQLIKPHPKHYRPAALHLFLIARNDFISGEVFG